MVSSVAIENRNGIRPVKNEESSDWLLIEPRTEE
jgi:hypothetical protein